MPHSANTFRQIVGICVAVCVIFNSCNQGSKTITTENYINLLNEGLTEAIVSDGFSPPVASRIYAYCNITAYEALACYVQNANPIVAKMKGWGGNSKFKPVGDSIIVAVVAFSEVAKTMVYRDYIIEKMADSLIKMRLPHVSSQQVKISYESGQQIAQQIIQWSNTDFYKETRNMPRYTLRAKASSWLPTSPTFGEALEPYWGSVNTMALDSSNQFITPGPPHFDSLPGSDFYALANQVYEYGSRKQILDSLKSIAQFWDCNPQKTNVEGHVMFNARQLTPGGHWVHIAKQICVEQQLNNLNTAFVLSITSIALADGFKCCWAEKFKHDLIRPETYIQRYIDKTWYPFLETPLFPEHPSGHSVVSAAAATVLEHFFGFNYAFIDSAEITYGTGIRKFDNLRSAADEAALSRVYGGIHYMTGCKQGMVLGDSVGKYVLTKFVLANN